MIKYPYLEKWISDHNMTQGEFARAIGVERTTVQKLLNGLSEPKKGMIDKVLEVTKMPYEVAFSETVRRKGT